MEVDGSMKVQNTTIFMGDNTRSERHNGGISEDRSGQKSLFAGNLNKKLDPVAKRQQEAKKQVMKIIGDARASDRKLEEGIEESRTKIQEYQKTLDEANGELKRIAKDKEEIRKAYGVEADSQEEQDLKLLEKKRLAARPGSDIRLTDEESQRIKEIYERGLTEYQEHSMKLSEAGGAYESEIDEAKKGIMMENYAIRSTKEAMLKSQTMTKAEKAADDVMEEARKDIIGMLTDEAKDHIDEELEEKKEAAEEKAEKEKEEEEKIEKQKAEKEEKEAFTEQIAASTELMVEAENTMDDVQKEIKKIMDEMKLLEEDIKGAAVDTSK